MATDKKISELPIISSVAASDVSVLVHSGTDYQYSFTTLLEFIQAGVNPGTNISFGTTLPQNITGKNGDVFINTSAGSFAQKQSGIWSVKYILPTSSGDFDGTVLYGSGVPGSSIGSNADTYINIDTGIFYHKAASVWAQVFSMQTGPQGPKGDRGDTGITGANGKTILNGTSNPSNSSTGTNGDFYLNTNTYQLFGPKTDGVWGLGTSIIGLTGDQGETGPQGDDGPTGESGAGVATGGAVGQVLSKLSSADFDTGWVDVGFVDISGQPEDNIALSASLSNKVDKLSGYDLSQENFTTAEKTKLATLSEHFKGKYITLTALIAANPTSALGDYATIDGGAGSDTKLYMWDGDDNTWVLSSDSTIPDATETSPGLLELATIAEALERTDDQRAMTALKTIALILDEKKTVSYQISPVGVNEVSILMENSGRVNTTLVSGASNVKLKIGITGTYPPGGQTYPFSYTAGDRVFITYNYSDLNNASCNVKLKCKDN